MDSLVDAIVALAASPWALVVVFALCVVDSIVPPLPTESVVIAIVAMASTGGAPHPLAIGVTITVAATLGDTLAYLLGRVAGRRRWLRHARVRRLARSASTLLRRRGASVVVAARFVPGLRIAVNATAGAMRMPPTRFVPLVAIAATMWAALTVAIGLGARWIAGDQPILAIVVGVVAGLAVGLVVDLVLRRRGVA